MLTHTWSLTETLSNLSKEILTTFSTIGYKKDIFRKQYTNWQYTKYITNNISEAILQTAFQ